MRKWISVGLVAYSAFLIGISVMPLTTGTSENLNEVYVLAFRLDYLLHVLIFAVWGVLSSIYAYRLANDRNKSLFFLFLVGLGLAVLTEYVQRFLPYRGYNVNDLVGNVVGVVVGFGVEKDEQIG
jgi:VanZ family protein